MDGTRDRSAAGLVVLFDGDCNLCDGLVGFLARRDRTRRLRFVPMGSPEGRATLADRGLDPDGLDTFVVLEGERTRVRSDAALAIVRRLDAPWSFLYQPNYVVAMRSNIKGYTYFPADTFTRYRYLSKSAD